MSDFGKGKLLPCEEQVSIVIPTKDRPQFVERLIRYYSLNRFKGRVLIGDSSESIATTVACAQEACRLYGLNIEVLHFPELSSIQTIRELLNRLATKYVAILPDDDFLIPTGLASCASFLEENEEYVAAHGEGVLTTFNTGEAFGEITDCCYYPQSSVLEESSLLRLKNYLANYKAILFSLSRADAMRRALNSYSMENPEDYDRSFLEEILPGCLLVTFGKVKSLEVLYLVRQTHPQRYFLPQRLDWVVKESWRRSYHIFLETLIETLTDLEKKEDRNLYKKTIEMSFEKYLFSTSRRSGEKKPLGALGLLKGRLKKNQVVRRVWYATSLFKTPQKFRFSLQQLTNRTSVDYEEFEKIRLVASKKN